MSFTLGGRRGSRVGPRASNFGQATRTQARVDSLVQSMATQRSEAIKVDGDDAVIWRKTSGSRVCSCSAQAGNDPANAQDMNAGVPLNPSDNSFAGAARGSTTSFDDYVPGNQLVNPFENDLEPDFDPEFERVEVGDSANTTSGYLDRVIEAGAYQTGALTKCPICCGTGYIDAWKPSRAVRLIGDFGPSASYELDHADLSFEARPNILRMQPRGTVIWQLQIPRYLERVLRVQVWHNADALDLVPDIDTGTPRGNPPNWVSLTPRSLLALNGLSGTCPVRVTSPDTLRITHLEILAMLANPAKVQVPIVNMPYDPEFVDYNTVATFEMTAEDTVGQGDLIAESKYGRIWRITGLQRSATSRNVVFGASAEVRAMQPDEIYWVLNPFVARDELI